MTPLLEIKDLHVSFKSHHKTVQAVRGINFIINKGETVALVGESGCGKSITAQTILRLIPQSSGMSCSGNILFKDENLLTKTEQEMRSIRGKNIGMIFQDPMTALNPTMRIGKQISEGLRKHQKISSAEAHQKVLEMLSLVGIHQPEKRIDQYPFEFSGGMRQRVMIAMALACGPDLLIADEPTTALDVTIQAQILDLLKELKAKQNTSILMITHDLGIVAGLCDRVIVMYAGQIMETGTVDEIFSRPQHPYTKALMNTLPKLGVSKKGILEPIIGSPPDLSKPPGGCPFHPRCQYAMKVCESHRPPLFEVSKTHFSACWLHHEYSKEKLV